MIRYRVQGLVVAFYFCVAGWPVTWWSSPASANEPVRLTDEVRAALKANAESLNPTTAVWEMRRTTPLSAKNLAEKLKFQGPPSEYTKDQVVRYCWQNGMTYSHTLTTSYAHPPSGTVDLREYGAKWVTPQPRTSKFTKTVEPPKKPRAKVSEIQESAIDLVNWYNGTGENPPDSEGSDSVILGIEPLDRTRIKMPRAKLVRPEFFYEAGYTLPTTSVEQGQSQKSLILARLDGEGDRLVAIDKVQVDDVPCMRVDMKATDRTYRFYLDPKLNYALRRREELTNDGRTLCVADCSDFMRFDQPEHWLPRLCRVTYFQWFTNPKLVSEEPLVHVTFTVKELDHRPITIEQFRINYRRPGANIADATLPEAKNLETGQVVYRVPADPAQLDAAIEAGKRGEDPDLFWSQRGPSRPYIFWIVLINGILLILAIGALIYFRGRHTHANQPEGNSPQ